MWDKIAKTGTYTDMHGKTYTFTSDDFKTIAANYVKAQEKAPLVVGHPSTDAPAYGWVASLSTDGDYLYAEYEKVSDDIKDAVNNGQYRHKSISLFPDLKRLKHVGLLGAVPPAMSGLGSVQFCENGGVILSFAENICNGDSSMAITLEEALQKIAELQTQLNGIQGELEKTAAEKKTLEEKAESSEANFSAFKKDVALKARDARVNALIAQGKLEPAKKDEVLKIAEKLSEGAPSFSGNSLEDDYLKSFEQKEANPLLAEFAAPEQGKQEQYSIKDIVDKL